MAKTSQPAQGASRTRNESTQRGKTQKRQGKALDLQGLLLRELIDLHSAERQLLEALPTLAEKAQTPSLKQQLEQHHQETTVHMDRLEQILNQIDSNHKPKICQAMKSIIKECNQMVDAASSETLKDAAIIAGAQRAEHYEISGYGTTAAWAQRLGCDEIATMLHQTLQDEYQADKALTRIAEQEVNMQAESGTGPSRDSQSDENNASRHGGALKADANNSKSAETANRSRSMPRDYDDRDDARYGNQTNGGRSSNYYYDRDDDRGNRSSNYDDRGGRYDGRSNGGRYPSEMQNRDEYGQFAGTAGGRGRSGYEDDRNGGSQGYSTRSGGYSRYNQDDDRNGYGNTQRSQHGYYQDQDRDYSARTGSSQDYGTNERSNTGRSSSRYDDYSSGRGYSGYEGRGSNYEDRARGGRHSSQDQDRDEYGQFTGTSGRGSRSRY